MALGRLVHATKMLGWDDLGQVEKRPGRQSDRNPINLSAVVRMELGGRMDRDPLPAAAATSAGDGDIDRGAGRLPEVPEHRGISVAEESPLAAGEYSSHPVALAAERCHRIYASVDPSKPALRHTAANPE